ncbi:MAG: retropepsin-like domain-containing protein [Pirellulales bacterium]|nr:retropepsin-like domain-containing protein [Pirellulales bacterium]
MPKPDRLPSTAGFFRAAFVLYLVLALVSPLWADTGTICFDLSPQFDQVVGGRIVLGPSDGISLDQGRVPIEIINTATQVSLGPFLEPELPPSQTFNWYNDFVLDTGANTVMLVGPGATHMADGFQTIGEFVELGVAGSELFDVSATYQFDFANSLGVRQTLSDVQILVDPNLDFGSFYGILGMPAMAGRVTSIDLTPLEEFEFVGVDFSQSAVPSGNGHRYSVAVDTRSEFYPGYGIPEDVVGVPQTPVWAHVPFLTATMAVDGQAQSGGFLLDTGAQMSMISEHLARDLLGIGPEVDLWDYSVYTPEESFPVGGIGGEVIVPTLAMDEIRVMTNEGVELVWTDLLLLALDIDESIDGIFGHDLMTSGYLNFLGDPGYIEEVHYDFRDFNLISRDPADANYDGVVDAADAAVLAAHWLESTDRGWFDGDFNGDGVVDDLDASILAARWQGGGQEGGGSVPEPGTWILLLTAAFTALFVSHRRRR